MIGLAPWFTVVARAASLGVGGDFGDVCLFLFIIFGTVRSRSLRILLLVGVDQGEYVQAISANNSWML